MIKPTVGRVINYWPSENDELPGDDEQPFAMVVVFVHDDHKVNLGGWDHQGNPISRIDVPLVQDTEAKPKDGGYCEWMDYQKGQAAKTEELEKQVAAKAKSHR